MPSGLSARGQPRDPIHLLAEEFVARYRRGERSAVSEYTARFAVLGLSACERIIRNCLVPHMLHRS
jgi:hypothetical protein